MDVFVARQPIFDSRKKLFAYELLFRTGMVNAFPDLDGETATTSLLSSLFFTIGIENISGDKSVFINFTEDLLLSETAAMFPAAKIMVEVLEDVHPGKEVFAACAELVAKGYQLALDDFVFNEDWLPFVKIATIIKVDFMLSPLREIEELVALVKPYECKLLAEKIETYQEFQQALDMGFEYFQGYFFAKPEILQNKEIPASKTIILQLITAVNAEEFDIDYLEKLIIQDVSISFKLLKYLNSAFFYRVHPLSSIRQAIVFLGKRGVCQFVSLIATAKLAESKPDELIRSSIIRGRMLELIAENHGKKNSTDYFMMGLFSLLDAMLDRSMTSLMEQLPIMDSVKDALSKREGEMFSFLQVMEFYETGSWEPFTELSTSLGLDTRKFPGYYLDAVGWADSDL